MLDFTVLPANCGIIHIFHNASVINEVLQGVFFVHFDLLQTEDRVVTRKNYDHHSISKITNFFYCRNTGTARVEMLY